MIIVAGILYLISAGNPGRIETAKKALIYAIAGIVISMLATAAVSLIKSALGAQ
jgi:NAD/NADP transhydrogenase beta subunit